MDDASDRTSVPIHNFCFGQQRVFWNELVTGEVRQVNFGPDGQEAVGHSESLPATFDAVKENAVRE